MEELLNQLLNWVTLHPQAFIIAVFFIALMESLVVLGLLIPGAALLFGAGALMATGTLPIMPIMLSTVAGAIVGDFISFLLGRHFHQRLRVIWPFRRYPRLMNRGVDFFVRHGGKSVFMARFIGPLRPIVPAIAGMMNMTTPRFLLVDVSASLLWAPVYILPGLVFGASLGLAAEVGSRLVVLLVLIVALVWLGVWLISTLIRILQPRLSTALEQLLEYSRRHRFIRPLAGSLLDPDHPEARGLTMLSVLFFFTLWLLLLISRQVLQGDWHNGIDAYIFHSLENLRTPWADHAMVFITRFGNQWLLLTILLTGCGWLFWKRNTKAAWHWLAAYASTGLLTLLLKNTVHIERPVDYHAGFSFPSAHTSMSLAVYGFLALLIARELPFHRRWLPYFTAGLLIVSIALSRLYLGVHWFSDVLAGLSLGVLWVTFIGIAYDRHPAPALPVRRFLSVLLVCLIVVGSWQHQQDYTQSVTSYALRTRINRITLPTWKEIGWQQLPAYRVDLEGSHEQPMNFQWAGSLATLERALQTQGWHPEPPFTPMSAINWLAPAPEISALPILPQVNDGQHQTLLLVKPHTPAENRLLVVRLWPADIQLMEGETPVWTGNVSYLYLEKDLPLIAYLRTAADFVTPTQRLITALGHADRIRLLQRIRPDVNVQLDWDGHVLLAWEVDD